MSIHIALIGAGGKMGSRVTNNVLKSDYGASYVETVSYMLDPGKLTDPRHD